MKFDSIKYLITDTVIIYFQMCLTFRPVFRISKKISDMIENYYFTSVHEQISNTN